MRLTQRLLERNMDIFKHIAPFCSKPSAWLFASFCIEIEKKKKSSSVHRQSHEHRQNEPPTTPPTRTTIYMTNGHPDRAWNRHVCFDIFCFVPFRYIRFSKLHSLPVFVYISFCFVPFRCGKFRYVSFCFIRFGIFRFAFHFAFYKYQKIVTGKVQVAYFENVISDWSIFKEAVLLSNQRFPNNSL
jgi:hypothetical protein